MEHLKWFFDFAYLDLERASEEDMEGWFQQCENIIREGKLQSSWGFIHPDPRTELGEIQTSFCGAFNSIMGTLKRARLEAPKLTKYPKPLKGKLHEGFQRIDLHADSIEGRLAEETSIRAVPLFHTLNLNVAVTPSLHIPIQHKRTAGVVLTRWKSNWQEQSFISLSVNPLGKRNDVFLMRFLEALNGVRLADLSECEECGRWFVKTTKHDRRYCGKACFLRKRMRDVRARMKAKGGKEYRQYQQKGIERAQKSYDSKHPAGVKLRQRNRVNKGIQVDKAGNK